MILRIVRKFHIARMNNLTFERTHTHKQPLNVFMINEYTCAVLLVQITLNIMFVPLFFESIFVNCGVFLWIFFLHLLIELVIYLIKLPNKQISKSPKPKKVHLKAVVSPFKCNSSISSYQTSRELFFVTFNSFAGYVCAHKSTTKKTRTVFLFTTKYKNSTTMLIW